MKLPDDAKAMRDVIKKLLEEHFINNVVTVAIAGKGQLQFYGKSGGDRHDFGIMISEGVEE